MENYKIEAKYIGHS